MDSLDQYFTKKYLIQALFDNVDIDTGCTVFEPCCGMGAIVRVLIENGFYKLISNDIDSTFEWCDYSLDATKDELWNSVGEIDWVITNPPYYCAFDILKKAWQSARVGVALHLRLSFIEPTLGRSKWLKRRPPTSMIVLPRESYEGGGSNKDSVTSAWFIWKKDEIGTISVIERPK